MSDNNPREPRKNEELAVIENILEERWQEFKAAPNHLEKVGNLVLFRVHLNEWLKEPEFVTDLVEGPAEGVERMAEDPEDAEYPFDKGGEAANAIFCVGHKRVSRLFTSEQWCADTRVTEKYGGFVVPVYEKLYATENETTAHFPSAQTMRNYTGTDRKGAWGEKDCYCVLADPAGCLGSSKHLCVYSSKSNSSARKKADTLAENFGIRFLVAKLVELIDNH